MAQFVKHFVQDLMQDIKIRQCGTIVFNKDNESNVISVDLYNGQEEYSGGGSVAGACICPDGSTVPLTGSIDGKTASVTLTGDCFAFPGQIGIGVQVVSGTVKTTVLKAIYNVELFETDDVIDPGSRITASVGQLVQDIEQATAKIPASDMASLMSGIAPVFSASTNYAAGAYVYYSGTLYRFTNAHAAGSWTGTDATAVALGNDVSELKSAVSVIDGLFSDDETLLSDHLENKSSTVQNIAYSLTGNVLSFSGTATSQANFSLLGSTSSELPDWLEAGGLYIFNLLTTDTGCNIRFMCKTESDTSLHAFAIFNTSGKYSLTIPADITVFMIRANVAPGVTVNGTATLELSGVITAKDAVLFTREQTLTDAQKAQALSNIGAVAPDDSFVNRLTVGESLTALSTLILPGSYYVPVARYASLTDLPSDIVNNKTALLQCFAAENIVYQWLWQKDAGFMWMRSIIPSSSTVGAWTEIHDSRNLVKVSNGDANNVVWNGYYGWGTSDAVLNTPNGVTAGTLVNINRDQNTKYQFAIDYYTQNIFVRSKKIGTWGTWDRIPYASEIPVVTNTNPLVQYGTVANDDVTEWLHIYYPQGDHYVGWYMNHYVMPSINCNVWRISSAYRFNADYSIKHKLTANGELECAVKLDDRSDFSGGSTHGDEVMTGWNVFLDGNNITSTLATALATPVPFTELRVVRASNLYDPADNTTIIAEHGCEYIYTADGLKINQSLKWKGAYNLENCFLAMFTPSKTYTDHVYTDNDFTAINLSGQSSFQYNQTNAQKTTIYGTNVLMEFDIERYPTGLVGGDKWSCTDNGGLGYNKIYYYCASGNAVSTNGELWKSTSVYKIYG